jgi:anti-sigma regulatory factor (Ser/Thr protein kinase)
MEEASHSYGLINDLGEVPELRVHFVQAVEDDSVEGDELDAWKLVFTELVCNAIEHGCALPDDAVRVHWVVVAEFVELQVTDPGDCHGNLEELFERDETDFSETGRGAGLILVRHFMDEIEVRPVNGGGTRIRARRYRNRTEHGVDEEPSEASA